MGELTLTGLDGASLVLLNGARVVTAETRPLRKVSAGRYAHLVPSLQAAAAN